jgi:hypothetical protein
MASDILRFLRSQSAPAPSDEELETLARSNPPAGEAPLDAESDVELSAALRAFDERGSDVVDPWGGPTPARHRNAGREYSGYSDERGQLLGAPEDYEQSTRRELEEYQDYLSSPRISPPQDNKAEREFLARAGDDEFTISDFLRRTQMDAGQQQADSDNRRARREARAQGLETARAKDKSRLRIVDANPALGTMLIRAGIPSEQVRDMTMEQADGLMKWLMSGGQWLANKNRGQDIGIWDTKLETTAGLRRDDVGIQSKMLMQDKDLASRERRAAMNVPKKKGEGGARDPEMMADQTAAWLAAQTSEYGTDSEVSFQQAKAFMQGDTSTLTPKQRESATVALNMFRGLSRKKQEETVTGRLRTEGGNMDRPGTTALTQAANPWKKWQAETNLANDGASIRNAMQSYIRLQNAGKLDVLSEYASDGWQGVFQNAQLGEHQSDVANIMVLLNELIHARTGAAGSNQEYARIARESGMPTSWDPLRDPRVIGQFLTRAKMAHRRKQKSYDANIKGGGGAGPSTR